MAYTIDVFNAGPDAARNVVVVDELPQSADGAAVTLISTSGCQNDPFTLTCELGDLAADTGATFTITVRVDGNTAGTITNTAIVSSESFDAGLSDNAAIAETVVIAATDLPIRGTDGTDHALTDRPSAYPIELADAGSAAALDAVVSDPLPAVVGTIEEAGVLTTLRSGATATPFAGPSLSLRVSVAAAPSSGVPSPRPNSPDGTLPVTGSNSSTPMSLAALWMLAAGLGIFTLGRTKRRSRSA